MLATGAFSPLTGFLNKADYDRVVKDQRLADGTLWPLPVTLPVTPGDGVAVGKTLALRDVYGNLLAFLHVEEIYAPDKEAEAKGAYGTTDAKHPAVAYLNKTAGHYAAGRLEVLRVPPHYDFVGASPHPGRASRAFPGRSAGRRSSPSRPATPAPGARGADQARGRADRRRPADPPGRGRDQAGRRGPLHPRPLLSRPGRQLLRARSVVLSLLPLAMRMAGPREVLLHAIIRRNYGCTHFIVGRDHAGPGNDSTGKPFYAPYAAQEAMAKYKDEIGMEMVDFKQMVFLPDENRYAPVDEVPKGTKTADISGTQVRDDYLAKGLPLPEWFSRPAVAEILNETSPPKFRQGLTIWFTGLSGSGKSDRGPGAGRAAGGVRPQRHERWTATRSARTCRRGWGSRRRTATPTSTAWATSPA